jgi:hypothetical protein
VEWNAKKKFGGAFAFASARQTATEIHVELTEKGALITDVHAFSVKILSNNGTYVSKKAAWEHSSDAEATVLATESVNGENYRQDIGEIVAMFSGGEHNRKLNLKRIAGKLRFTRQEEGNDESV